MTHEGFVGNESGLHGHFMKMALELARKALGRGEFPVGCVLVGDDGKVVADGRRDGTVACGSNELDHAEMNALRKLEPLLHKGDVKAENVTCYCTLEPCLMCYAALLIHGIRRIVYAYEDAMGGGSSCDLNALPPLYSKIRPVIVPDVMRSESLALFQKFWSDKQNTYLADTLICHYTMNLPPCH